MKIYQHSCSLLVREEDNTVRVIYDGNNREFYEGYLTLDLCEDIINFYQDNNILVYYTTKKRIIATSLKKCEYQCLYGENEHGPFDETMPRRVYVENKVVTTKVLNVDVETVIFGSSSLVYYDGNFHMICHKELHLDMDVCDMMCYSKEDLDFQFLNTSVVIVPFNSSRIMQVTIAHKDELPRIDKDYPGMYFLDTEYMLCDLGNNDYYVIFFRNLTTLACQYVCSGEVNLTVHNLMFDPSHFGEDYKCAYFMVKNEDKLYYYDQEAYMIHPIDNEKARPMTNALEKAGLQNASPIFIRSGVVCDGTTNSIDVYVVDTHKEGVFKTSDVHYGSDGFCFINSRGRIWKNGYNFIIMTDEKETLFYTHKNITNLECLESDKDKIHVYKLPQFSLPIKFVRELNDGIFLFSEYGEIIYMITSVKINTKGKCRGYEFEIKEINFSRHKHRIQHNLISYDSNEYRNYIHCHVDEDNYLDTLMRLCGLFPDDYFIHLNIMGENEEGRFQKASGDGAARSLIHNALKEFSTLYLEGHEVRPSFKHNITLLEKRTLRKLGATLNMMIDLMKGPLSIRLPLVLVEAISSRELTITDFEYFAKIQDPIAFSSLFKYKRNPDGFSGLGTGYSCYEEALRDMCGYPVPSSSDAGSIIESAVEIGVGFIRHRHLEKIERMNIATLDHYLSGPYFINRKDLCQRIKVTETSVEESIVVKKIHEIVMGINEAELTQLLINWSGVPIIKEEEYNVVVRDNKDLFFGTCSLYVNIPSIYFSDECNLRSSSAKASSITDFLTEDLVLSSGKPSSITDFLAEDLKELLVSPLNIMKD